MPVKPNVEILGAKEAVRSLNKLEPGLRKEFTKDATRIAQPAISEAQSNYQRIGVPLSGMESSWTSNGRKLFPYSVSKAMRGVKVKVEGDRRKTSVILIEQRDPATAVWETAGRVNPSRFGDQLGQLSPGTSRVLGPSVFRKRPEIESEMSQAVLAVVERVEKELK